MENKRVKAAILGASGYTGLELARLLVQHPQVEITGFVSQSHSGKAYSSLFPAFTGVLDTPLLGEKDIESLAETSDVLFYCLPHGIAASKIDAKILERVKVIDLSADFRLRDAGQYDEWYALSHPRPELLSQAVYGLPEWRRKEIVDARLIANPGCYATCTLLAMLPLAAGGFIAGSEVSSIVVDAKSGVSGAGRAAAVDTLFSEVNESLKAYKVGCHRHTPEIEQELRALSNRQVVMTFTPHLIPMNRGILVTAYCKLNKKMTSQELADVFTSAYADEPFVKIVNAPPETRSVRGTNYCHIHPVMDSRTDTAIILAVIDNLVKGAAGQAVQNLNLMHGLPETTGLLHVAAVP